ncbi:hypothetical protein [Holospora undulata]|nr:hypothetical protein [Holospora undulata]
MLSQVWSKKLQHTLAKLFGRGEKSIIAHMFILRWGAGLGWK